MVPVYFVDRPATDSRDDEQVRIAVNGQTGRAAAVVFSDKRETHVLAPLNPSLHLSGESTVHATPIEVKYVKSPFLYQIVRRGGGEQPRQVAAAAEGSYREEKPSARDCSLRFLASRGVASVSSRGCGASHDGRCK